MTLEARIAPSYSPINSIKMTCQLANHMVTVHGPYRRKFFNAGYVVGKPSQSQLCMHDGVSWLRNITNQGSGGGCGVDRRPYGVA